jgi:hypothetical protein
VVGVGPGRHLHVGGVGGVEPFQPEEADLRPVPEYGPSLTVLLARQINAGRMTPPSVTVGGRWAIRLPGTSRWGWLIAHGSIGRSRAEPLQVARSSSESRHRRTPVVSSRASSIPTFSSYRQ